MSIYVAVDSDGYGGPARPGNGGIRLLDYATARDAVDDAARLATGMTRKHDMFRTGFSGAKVVVRAGRGGLAAVDRGGLMGDVAAALDAFAGGVYTGCDLNTGDVVSGPARTTRS